MSREVPSLVPVVVAPVFARCRSPFIFMPAIALARSVPVGGCRIARGGRCPRVHILARFTETVPLFLVAAGLLWVATSPW